MTVSHESDDQPLADAPPLLRTLAPLLRGLGRELRAWLTRPRRQPPSVVRRAELEGIAGDLDRHSEALDADQPLLIIMLMGGTGVGKSTLLNALAGAPVAQASFTRPTTRDPVIYYHESLRPDRFDPRLRHCRLVQHDRVELAQKLIIDTPDLDSNDPSNREKLEALLPLADVVLYVGSQEKYHDQIGWDLFKHQRKRRAFAFVLNKWDRCVQRGAEGLTPDEDLLRDLKAEGFQQPLLFRTVAQKWLDHLRDGGSLHTAPEGLPEGEQFPELLRWLEMGLTRLEIEAVKARGVSQLLTHLGQAMQGVRPPDLTLEAERTREAWERLLDEEAEQTADVLLSTLDPYQSEIEHHFSLENQTRFRGLIAGYLRLVSRVKYAGSTLRERLPLVPRSRGGTKTVEPPRSWDLAAFTRECVRTASERALDRRRVALANRLTVEADRQQFPLTLLSGPTNEATRLDWYQRYDRALVDALTEVERKHMNPTGWRRFLQGTLVISANIGPELVFLGSLGVLLTRYFMNDEYRIAAFDIALPFLLTLVALIFFQILIALLLPLRWSAIREDFHERLAERLQNELKSVYATIPGEMADALSAERREVEEMLQRINETANWLREREQAASVAGLYGD